MPPAKKTKVEEEAPAKVEEEVKKPVAKKAAVKTATKKAPAKVPAPKSVLVRVIGKAPVVVGGFYLYPGETKLVNWAIYKVAHKASPGRIQVRITPEDEWQGSPPNKYI
jgi:hypothetical protein